MRTHTLHIVIGLLLLHIPSAAIAAERPNIVWIIPDDMSANFSCYGETAIETPNVDRLAARGVRFTNAYVTAPVCSTCRSAFITGMYQTSIGAHHHRSGRGEKKSIFLLISSWSRSSFKKRDTTHRSAAGRYERTGSVRPITTSNGINLCMTEVIGLAEQRASPFSLRSKHLAVNFAARMQRAGSEFPALPSNDSAAALRSARSPCLLTIRNIQKSCATGPPISIQCG